MEAEPKEADSVVKQLEKHWVERKWKMVVWSEEEAVGKTVEEQVLPATNFLIAEFFGFLIAALSWAVTTLQAEADHLPYLAYPL